MDGLYVREEGVTDQLFVSLDRVQWEVWDMEPLLVV